MGYTTEFHGQINIDPILNDDEATYLTKFAETRRMNRKEGPYFVDGKGVMGQDEDSNVINGNRPDPTQPSLWCQWVPDPTKEFIGWDGGDKFYEADFWMKYLINEFLTGEKPRHLFAIQRGYMPTFQKHVCNGFIEAQGEEHGDNWAIEVTDNKVTIRQGLIQYNWSRGLYH